MTYLWLRLVTSSVIIFWMAGLFMLPRFFVYHQETTPGSPAKTPPGSTANASC